MTETTNKTVSASREAYFDVLEQAVPHFVFFSKMASILDADPYFTPAHLEMIWRAAERNDTYLHSKLVAYAYEIIKEIAADRTLQETLRNRWSSTESEALAELFTIIQEHVRMSVRERFAMKLQRTACSNLLSIQTDATRTKDTHLRRVQSVDISALQEEIAAAAPYWWQIDTQRQERVIHHQDTYAIALRIRAQQDEYVPVDGPHEGAPSGYEKRFPIANETITQLAKELNLGLGRVAIVMMRGRAQAYRHYDAETYLIGRDRHHLVVQCGENNILSAGTETITAKEGELWFFDNQVMHRAYNGSDTPRIHIIFDGKPLG